MHPLIRSRALLAGYLFGWLAFGVVFLFSARIESAPWKEAILLAAIAAGLAAVLFPYSYYSCRALPLRSTPPPTLAAGWIGSALVMGGLWSALLLAISKHLQLLPPHYLTWQGWVSFGLTGSFMYLVTVAMHYVIIAHQHSEESLRTEQELRELAREAELKALRAQLNPHFLFNSLNSISALTSIDPKGARKMCVLLADFLRKSLKLGERPIVPLAEELTLLRAYLDIEQIRFGNRLRVEWSVDAEAEKAEIPTLLLQPLVENAIKHGIAQLPEGGILRFSAHASNGFVEVLLENARDPEADVPAGLGMGLQQVKRRLRGRYGNGASFEAKSLEAGFVVAMTFPIDAGDDSHD
jgi:two-component system, LytTR family, sensor histidine kinase AlgZ